MARLIFKCRYLKSGGGAAGYLKYIATREGVEKLADEWKRLRATEVQQKMIRQLLKDFPDMRDSFEHQDFQQSPTRGAATEFITAALDQHADQFARREQYVKYISQRPRVERHGSHGLFSDTGEPIALADVMREVAAHDGAVYTPIISLRREDAARLGFDSAARWRNLLRSHAATFAEQFKIPPDDLRWYAAFHNESHHPHVHMILYSASGQAYLTRKGLDGMRSALARDIFKQDLMQIYEQQTQHRDELRREARELVRQIATGNYNNSVVDDLLRQLAGKLAVHKGKKVYGYLNQPTRNMVNAIVDELAKDENIAQLYDLWYEQREAVLSTYKSEMPERVPLSQNSEFKSIKNAVIAEAAKLVIEPKPVVYHHVQTQSEVMLSAQTASPRLLGSLADLLTTRILEEPQPKDSHVVVESKLWREEQERKAALGLH